MTIPTVQSSHTMNKLDYLLKSFILRFLNFSSEP